VERTLQSVAIDFATEIHDRKWDHIACLKAKPAGACPEIIDELRKRSPGHTLEQYQRALADGLFNAMK
jgi:hypothetical protein